MRSRLPLPRLLLLSLVRRAPGLGEDADDAALCEDLLERRVGMGLFGLCDLLEFILLRRREAAAEGDRIQDLPEEHTKQWRFAIERASTVLSEALQVIAAEYEDLEPEREEAAERQRQLLASSISG